MAASTHISTKGNPNGETETLFQGKKFWLSLNVPQRQRFRDLIQINGGTVVLYEKDADIKLVDHTKRDIPLNTYSYKYVERSIQNGRLEDIETHRAGKSIRPVGAHGIPSRHHRVTYTLEDDQILWDWLQPYEEKGIGISGNVIYQELAEQCPQHTFQSWRDRYLKRLRGSPRPGGPRRDQGTNTVDDGRQQNTPSSVPSEPSRSSSTIRMGAPGRSDLTPPQSLRLDGQAGQTMRSSHHPRQVKSVGTLPAMNADSTHTEPYPPHTPNAHERPAPSQKPTTTAAPANTRRFPARRSPDKSAMAQGNAEKRKRLSEETLPTIPGFDVNELASRKRRATDFIPRGEPSTPDQPHRVRVKIDEKEIDNDTVHDDTNSIEFETAPQFSVSFNTAPSQSRPWTTDTNDDELNLQAFMELPFPPADSDSDGPGESVHEDKNDEQVARELDIWIADRLRTGRAKSEQHLVTALACTSMDPEVADRVLDSLAAGQGIPENMEGVWTDEDDATLEGTDARGIERLLKKHGTEFYSARFKYLAALREAQNASDRGV